MTKTIQLLALCILMSFSARAQGPVIVHSHNDYYQSVPFWHAFSSGAGSIEADIFVRDGDLFVAHDPEEIRAHRTLDALYLRPLASAIKMGYVGDRELFLLIDIKSEALSTLKVLVNKLRDYPEIINNPKIKTVVSGNRPKPDDYSEYPSFILFDHQELDMLPEPRDLERIGMVSVSFRGFSKWNGKGRLTHADHAAVTTAIGKAKRFNKPFRFWATPDSESAWKAMSEMGVSLVNTDSPYACTAYLKSLPDRMATIRGVHDIYMPDYEVDQRPKAPKNIVLMIGDGNGLSQISSAVLANNGALTLTQLKTIGLIKTQSADDFTTDSAAAGTALATGTKTNNRAIGTDSIGQRLTTISELLHQRGFSTACITNDAITGATPAAFYAHVKDRSQTDAIARDLVRSDLDLFIGGGRSVFANSGLGERFKLLDKLDQLKGVKADKIGILAAENGLPSVRQGRGDWLARATKMGLAHLDSRNKPFFTMVEAAQIDSFGHSNDPGGIVSETLDFDKAIAEALKFADADGETLVIVTADHETGGFSLPQGNLDERKIEGDFTTHDHTGTMVPIFAYGPRSDVFSGVYENTQVFHKILECLGAY